MPSASSKHDKPTPAGVEEPLKQAIGLVEKKVRNLEKRKGKLDDLRARKAGGTKLEKDQEEAIVAYDVVDKNLAFAREMATSFLQLETEIEKLARKQVKRERLERQAADAARCKAMFVLTSTLDSMGAEDVREHFINGTSGAIKVTEENLDQLDELYKLINPSRETENSFEDELKAAAEHMACYLEPRDKEVLGTNYKDIRALVDSIHESGYFDKRHEELSNGEATAEEEAEEETEAQEPDTTEPTFVPEEAEAPVAEEKPVQVAEVSESRVPEPTIPVADPVTEPAAPIAHNAAPSGYSDAEAASYYSTAPYQRRDFQEIVSSVKGTYSFLQDSHIDGEPDGLHMDPAVLAAQPIRTTLTAQPEQPSTLTFQNSNYLAEESLKASADMHTTQKSHTQDSFHPTQQTYQQQGYLSQSQGPPAAIPMPNQSALDSQDKKAATMNPNAATFTMNPNAAMFQPMFDGTPAGGPAATEQVPPTQPPAVAAQPIPEPSTGAPPAQEVNGTEEEGEAGYDQDRQEQGEFQGWGNFRGGRGGGRGRGRGGNMSNGFSRGGRGSQNAGYNNQRGGQAYNGNDQRGGQRGGYRGGNDRGNDRGGNSNYQGYPPRQDYKPDSYQGHSNGGAPYNNQRGGRAPRGDSYRGSRGGPQSGGRGGNRAPYNNQQPQLPRQAAAPAAPAAPAAQAAV